MNRRHFIAGAAAVAGLAAIKPEVVFAEPTEKWHLGFICHLGGGKSLPGSGIISANYRRRDRNYAALHAIPLGESHSTMNGHAYHPHSSDDTQLDVADVPTTFPVLYARTGWAVCFNTYETHRMFLVSSTDEHEIRTAMLLVPGDFRHAAIPRHFAPPDANMDVHKLDDKTFSRNMWRTRSTDSSRKHTIDLEIHADDLNANLFTKRFFEREFGVKWDDIRKNYLQDVA